MNEDYLKKWLDGTLNEDEKVAFENTPEFQSLQRILRAAQAFKAPAFDVHAESTRLPSRTTAGREVTVNWFRPFLKVAAVLLMAAGVYFTVWYDPATMVHTSAAEMKEVILPDSSVVILNALSSLSYTSKKRSVELTGEAFFKVFKGSKFDVETRGGTVSVLGTEFNVIARDNYFEVTCHEGLVQVKTAESTTLLHPTHLFRLLKGHATSDTVPVSVLPAWVNNESTFESVPFWYVIQEFERQYDVKVTLSKVDTNQLFTGSFIHDNLPLAIQSISVPLNITYSIGEGKVIIFSGESD